MQMLLNALAPNQVNILLKNPDEGLRYFGTYHKKKGKVIQIHNASPEHMAFLAKAENLLSFPPEKRP
jgi:hypothetical protein